MLYMTNGHIQQQNASSCQSPLVTSGAMHAADGFWAGGHGARVRMARSCRPPICNVAAEGPASLAGLREGNCGQEEGVLTRHSSTFANAHSHWHARGVIIVSVCCMLPAQTTSTRGVTGTWLACHTTCASDSSKYRVRTHCSKCPADDCCTHWLWLAARRPWMP
jgi:hypothetical protein